MNAKDALVAIEDAEKPGDKAKREDDHKGVEERSTRSSEQ